ncbi:hypothetical protein Dimus_039435 [Dionaea muscipula]
MLGRRFLRPDLTETNHNLRRPTNKKKTSRTHKMANIPRNDQIQPPNNVNGPVDGVNGAQDALKALNAKNNGGNGVANPLHAHFIPNVYDIPSCIELPVIVAPNYEIKSETIQSLPSFTGLSQEDPYSHLSEFLSISSTLKITNFPVDTMRLILFSFSLRGQAKHWLSTLPPRTIRTWEEMSAAFLKKYFSVGKTIQYRREITTFQQHSDEYLFESWERFGDLLRKYPHHAIPKWQLVQIFYFGLLPQHRQMMDASCGGSVMMKDENEVWTLFENLSDASQLQSTFDRRDKPVAARTEMKKDVNELSVTKTLTSTIAALSDKVELLLKRDIATTPVSAPPRLEACVTRGSTAHHWTVCSSTRPPRLTPSTRSAPLRVLPAASNTFLAATTTSTAAISECSSNCNIIINAANAYTF